MDDLVKVYIVEDAAIARASLETMLLENEFEVVGSAAKAEKAWEELQKLKVDLLLVDINLAGEKNGIWLAEQIRAYFNIPLVFLTAYGDQKTLKEVLDTKPNGYLMKPYQEPTLITTINIALENFYDSNNVEESIRNKKGKEKEYPEYLFVKKNKKVVKIDVSSIYYILVEEKYSKLKCKGSSYIIKMSLKKIMELLPAAKFKQVHRNCLVNVAKIKEIYFVESIIVLDNNEKVHFSERYKSIFRKENDIFC